MWQVWPKHRWAVSPEFSLLIWDPEQDSQVQAVSICQVLPKMNEKCVELLDASPGSHKQWWCLRQRETRILGESGTGPILAKVPKLPLLFYFIFFGPNRKRDKIAKASCPISLQHFSFFYTLTFFPLYHLYSIPAGKVESHLGTWNPFHLGQFFQGDSKAWTNAGDRLLRFQFFLGFSSSSVKRAWIDIGDFLYWHWGEVPMSQHL